jgi:hypothetical protein
MTAWVWWLPECVEACYPALAVVGAWQATGDGGRRSTSARFMYSRFSLPLWSSFRHE